MPFKALEQQSKATFQRALDDVFERLDEWLIERYALLAGLLVLALVVTNAFIYHFFNRR